MARPTLTPQRLISLTTTQRNTLTAGVGDKIWNSTTGREEVYNGTAWVALVNDLNYQVGLFNYIYLR